LAVNVLLRQVHAAHGLLRLLRGLTLDLFFFELKELRHLQEQRVCYVLVRQKHRVVSSRPVQRKHGHRLRVTGRLQQRFPLASH
jgi:hypothetical protein